MDVVLAAAVPDERIRYQLARAIAALGPPAPGFPAALRALREPRPVVARGLSRLAAGQLASALGDFGIAATAEAAGKSMSRIGSAPRRLAAIAAAGTFLLGGALLLSARTGTPAILSPRAGRLTTSISHARAIPWSTPSAPLSPRDLAALATPATVEIRYANRRSAGFFAARDVVLFRDEFFRNEVADGSSVEVALAGGRVLPGRITTRDARSGLALVSVPGSGVEPLLPGDAASLQPGDPLSIGERQARMGSGSRQLQGIAFLSLAADLRSEDSGRPVLDARGYVVGLVAGVEPALLPINYACDEAPLLRRPGPSRSSRTWRELLAEVATAEELRLSANP